MCACMHTHIPEVSLPAALPAWLVHAMHGVIRLNSCTSRFLQLLIQLCLLLHPLQAQRNVPCRLVGQKGGQAEAALSVVGILRQWLELHLKAQVECVCMLFQEACACFLWHEFGQRPRRKGVGRLDWIGLHGYIKNERRV